MTTSPTPTCSEAILPVVAACEETLNEKLRVSTDRIKQIGGWVLIAAGLYLTWFYLREGYP